MDREPSFCDTFRPVRVIHLELLEKGPFVNGDSDVVPYELDDAVSERADIIVVGF